MGVMIKGDPRGQILFPPKAIALATGLKESAIHTRIKALGIETNRGGYTYEQVVQIVKYRTAVTPEQKAAILKDQLKKDGFL